jgi:hypothetical protein
MRTSYLWLIPIILGGTLLAAADEPVRSPITDSATITVSQETLRQMVQEEVRHELPAAVQAEVRKQITEISNRNARINSAASTLQTMRGQLELYKIQHEDEYPALSELASWKALTSKTDVEGAYTNKGGMMLGPYLQSAPVNPFTGASNVVAAGKATVRDGWSWEADAGHLRVVIPASETEAVQRYGDEAEVPGRPVADVRKDRVRSIAPVLQTLRGQLELYKIQHADQFPTWNQMAGWRAMLNGTDANGDPGKKYGPYIPWPPVNPVTGKSAIAPAGSADGQTGWVYDGKSGQIRAVVSADDQKDAANLLGAESVEVAK